jgi:hypothetical protein
MRDGVRYPAISHSEKDKTVAASGFPRRTGSIAVRHGISTLSRAWGLRRLPGGIIV